MSNNLLFPYQHNQPSDQRALAQKIVNCVSLGYSPRDIEREMFLFELSQLEKHQPHIAHVIRACALAPYINADIIGVLREKSDDSHKNQHLYQELRRLAFIGKHRYGIRFDAAVRNFLIDDWQNNPETQTIYHQRLHTYFQNLGKDYFAKREFSACIDALSQAITLQPEQLETYSRRGQAYHIMG